ncbi:MAG: acyltransferase [Candidatus Methylacidiphilaceae bacterium]
MKSLVVALSIFLPWWAKRRLLQWICGYEIADTARIGFSWVAPQHLRMGPSSSIGHGNICKRIRLLELKPNAAICHFNWISGYPEGGTEHYAKETDRKTEVILEEQSAITNRHLIDATDQIRIGAFSILAGARSQIVTHRIDFDEPRQTCAPVEIGAYCFVGTACVLLAGAKLPNYSVLGAMSLLKDRWEKPHMLYAGVPAKPIKPLDPKSGYFQRKQGFVL